MTWEEAIRQSILKYNDDGYVESDNGAKTYTKKYFDDFEKELENKRKGSVEELNMDKKKKDKKYGTK